MNDSDFNSVLKWWDTLEKERGERAELRRAHNITEVAFSPAYHRLYKELPQADKEKLACVAGICAHVKENSEAFFAKQMAEGNKSDLRFRRLLAIENREELYHAMIRIVRLLGGTVNVCDLAKTIYWWNENTKKRLAYDYYANAKNTEV